MKLGKLEPYDPNNKEHNNPDKYVIDKKGDAFVHTLEALRKSDVKDKIVNLGILFHDLGKANTHSLGDDGLHHYFGHAKESADIIDSIADRLKIDNKTKNSLKFSALNHMKIHDLLKMSNSKIMDMMEDPNWDILISVAKADAMARGDMFDEKEWSAIEDKIAELKERFKGRQAIRAIKKIVNGNLVMELRPEIKPSPELGKIINTTVDWILNNNIDVEKDIDKIKTFIRGV